MLSQNYRSHECILGLPNLQFYDGALEKCADEMQTSAYLQPKPWEMLVNKSFPIVFHGVMGKNQKEGNSPSWFNASEAEV
eukprot:862570-Alexandrium_andersonii.AAC.1